MATVTRIHKGPHPTPRPNGEDTPGMSFEDIAVSRAKMLIAGAAVASIALLGGLSYVVSNKVFSKPPSIEQIKDAPTDTKPESYNPDKEGQGRIPTSGAESE